MIRKTPANTEREGVVSKHAVTLESCTIHELTVPPPQLSHPSPTPNEIFLIPVTAEGVSNTPTLQLFFKVTHEKGWRGFLSADTAGGPVKPRSGSL